MSKASQHLSQQELESYLWGAANLLRGLIDAGDYKQYVFPLLFFKRLSDVWDEEHAAALADTGDESYGRATADDRFRIPEGAHWADVRNASRDVGRALVSAFRAIECQAKSPRRRVTSIEVTRTAEWLTIAITANAFLHHMVRNVAGLLMSVGHGESPQERVATVLASRDRKSNAATAPPDGLYLAAVRYPAEFGLPGAAADTGNLPQSAIIDRCLVGRTLV